MSATFPKEGTASMNSLQHASGNCSTGGTPTTNRENTCSTHCVECRCNGEDEAGDGVGHDVYAQRRCRSPRLHGTPTCQRRRCIEPWSDMALRLAYDETTTTVSETYRVVEQRMPKLWWRHANRAGPQWCGSGSQRISIPAERALRTRSAAAAYRSACARSPLGRLARSTPPGRRRRYALIPPSGQALQTLDVVDYHYHGRSGTLQSRIELRQLDNFVRAAILVERRIGRRGHADHSPVEVPPE
jgi:hypothetical protein